jgi:hypothetical protein
MCVGNKYITIATDDIIKVKKIDYNFDEMLIINFRV